MQIEDAIFSNSLPVNMLVVLNRIKDLLLSRHLTNGFIKDGVKDDPDIKKLMWLLNASFYGQLAKIDVSDMYMDLCKEHDAKK